MNVTEYEKKNLFYSYDEQQLYQFFFLVYQGTRVAQ